jgi:hypothetical protein
MILPEELFVFNDNVETKHCESCNTTKPITEFNSNGKDGSRYRCRACDRNAGNISSNLRRVHGEPPADYKCPGCELTTDQIKTRTGRTTKWDIDHHHETGEFRGWLCHKCNPTLGNAKDSSRILANLIHYLEHRGSYGESITVWEFTKVYVKVVYNRIKKLVKR